MTTGIITIEGEKCPVVLVAIPGATRIKLVVVISPGDMNNCERSAYQSAGAARSYPLYLQAGRGASAKCRYC